MERPTNNQTVTYEVAAFEVLLTFVDDYDAELFEQWFEGDGWDLFQAWVEDEEG